MSGKFTSPRGTIPGFRYRNAPAAIEFLKKAFGFEENAVYPGESEGEIAHAQLTLGQAMIMLGSGKGGEFDKLRVDPKDAGGVTSSVYIVVENIDELYENAKAAGAEIVMEICDQDYGSRDFSARDPEGYVWSFGTYDPWESGE
ncbi:VOC family protein [bacterium]|nr:VOC family protein [bacterium]